LALPAFGAQITFSPRLTLSEEYTDNVFRVPDIPELNAQPEEDFIFRISPGATLDVVGRRADLRLAYDPYYSDYKNNTRLSRWSHVADLAANWQMTRDTRAFLTDNFFYGEDPTQEDAVTGRSGRNPYFRNTSVVGLTSQFGDRSFVTLQYTHREFREDTEFGAPSDDSTTYSPELRMAYWFNSRWGVDGRLQYTNGQFEITEDVENIYADLRLLYNFSRRWDFFVRYAHTYQDYKEESEDYQIYYPSLGFEYTYDENTFLSLQGGPLVRNFEDRSEEYGVTFIADGQKRWLFQRANINVFIRNGIDYDYASTQNLGLFYFTTAGGTANYTFTRNFSGNVTGSYRYNAYVDLDPERYDNIYQAGAGLQWLVTHFCSLRLNYDTIDRQSTDELEEYAENRVYLGLSFFPRSPYYLKR
jgi:hypothetical protein